MVTEILSTPEGIDGVVLDLEHSCFNMETIYSCIQVARLAGKRCFIRVSHWWHRNVQSLVDAGADVILSNVENTSLLRQLTNITFSRRKGGKRGTGLVRNNTWGEEELIYEDPILVAQIETELAVERIADLNAGNIGFYMIGQYDLSASLGCPGKFKDPKFIDVVNKVEEEIGKGRMGVHLVRNCQDIDRYRDYGVVALGMDTTTLLDRTREITEWTLPG